MNSFEVNKGDLNAEKHRWAHFLQANMQHIEMMNINVYDSRKSSWAQNNVEFAAALDTPAPYLQEFTLIMGDNTKGIESLFSGTAPLLHRASISTNQQFHLSHFTSLKVLKLKISVHFHAQLLAMVPALLELEELDLFGSVDCSHATVPDASETRVVLLPSCRSLALKRMGSPLASYLLSSMSVSKLERLSVHEKLLPKDGVLEASFLQALALIAVQSTGAATLQLALQRNHLFVKASGTPVFAYSVDCSYLEKRCHFDEAEQLLEIAVPIFTMLSTNLSMQPKELVIELCQHAPASPLYMMDQSLLWRRVFAEYDHVEVLRLSGDTAEVIEVLNSSDSYFPLLSEVQFTEGTLVASSDLEILLDISRERAFSVSVY